MGAKRLKIFIFSFIAVIAMLCVALVSVSFAKWDVAGGGSSSVNAEGSTGKFYVDYPYTAQASSVLQLGEHYIGVTDDSGVTDYFYPNEEGISNDGKPEHKFYGIWLKQGQEATFYFDKKPIATPMYHTNSGYHGTLNSEADGVNKIFTASYSAWYEFYLSEITNAGGEAGHDLYIESNPLRLDLQFRDRTIRIHLKTDSINAHIWHHNDTTGIDTDLATNSENKKGWPGQSCGSKYASTDTDETNLNTIDLSDYKSTDNVNLIFNYENSSAPGNYWQTSGMRIGTTFPSKGPYYLTLAEGTPSYGSYPLNFTNYTKPVSSENVLSATNDADDEKTVREVSADNTNIYHNYVCVSRVGGTGATMAYVNFSVSNISVSTIVTGFSITRTGTENDGLPIADSSASVFVYNDPTGQDISAINSTGPSSDVEDNGHLNEDYVEGGTYIMLYFGAGEDQYYALDVTIETENATSFTLTATASNIDKRNRYDAGYGAPFGYYLGGEFNGMDMWDPRYAAKLEKTTEYTDTYYRDPSDNTNATGLRYTDDQNNVNLLTAPTYIDVSLDIEFTATNDTIKLMHLGAQGERQAQVGNDPTLWFIPLNVYKNYNDSTGSDDTVTPPSEAAGLDEIITPFNKDMNIIIKNPGTYRIRFVGNVQYKNRDENGNNSDENGIYAFDRKEGEYLSKSEFFGMSAAARGVQVYDKDRNMVINRYVELGNWNGVVDSLFVTRLEDEDGVVGKVKITFYAGESGTVRGDRTYTTTDEEDIAWGGKLSDDLLTMEAVNEDGTKTFLGWYDAPTGGNKITASTVIAPTANTLTLYAHYSVGVTMYTIIYVLNGGTNHASNPTQFLSTDSAVTLQTPTPPAGQSFVKWTLDDENGQKVTQITPDNVDSLATNKVIVLYANYENLYTVTFDVNIENGGSGTNTVYNNKKAGDTITKPATDPTPSDELYDFDGWYTDATGGTKVTTFPNVGTTDVTYYAHYTRARYRVVVDVSDWPEWLSSGSYSYHIHAWGGIGVGTVTGTSGNEWNTRPEMKSMGDNKYYYDLSATGITNIIFTRDASGIRNEYMRYELSGLSGFTLGNTYTYEATRENVGFDGYRKVKLKFNQGESLVFIKGVTGIRYWNCDPANDVPEDLSTLPDTLTCNNNYGTNNAGGINMIYMSDYNYTNKTEDIWWMYNKGVVHKYSTYVSGKLYESIAIDTFDSNGNLGSL